MTLHTLSYHTPRTFNLYDTIPYFPGLCCSHIPTTAPVFPISNRRPPAWLHQANNLIARPVLGYIERERSHGSPSSVRICLRVSVKQYDTNTRQRYRPRYQFSQPVLASLCFLLFFSFSATPNSAPKMDLNTYSYLPYQSGGRRSVASSSGAILGSPSYYAGARMMVRHPSNGSQASVGSAYAVSTASSSPGGHSPVSPGADITNSLSYMDFHGSSGQQEYQHQQQVGAMYQAAPTYYDYQSNYRSPVAPIQSTPASSCEDWCQYYDFIAEVEHGQAPYWRLKDGFSPNQNYPSVRPTITGSDAAT